MALDMRQALGIDVLRASFLEYTREAFSRIPGHERPCILDIGCGRGTSTIELARISDSKVVGFDIDEGAVTELREKIEQEKLSHRVRAFVGSLLDADLLEQSFDILWEEGVIHVLDLDESLAMCHRLLRPGGHLVCAETVYWLDQHLGAFTRNGFELVDRVLWRSRCWWTEYYAVLEQRVDALRGVLDAPRDLAALQPYEAEIAMIKKDVSRSDCGHYLFRKIG